MCLYLPTAILFWIYYWERENQNPSTSTFSLTICSFCHIVLFLLLPLHLHAPLYFIFLLKYIVELVFKCVPCGVCRWQYVTKTVACGARSIERPENAFCNGRQRQTPYGTHLKTSSTGTSAVKALNLQIHCCFGVCWKITKHFANSPKSLTHSVAVIHRFQHHQSTVWECL